MITIKNRYTGATIRTVDADTLACANLHDADLRGANLYDANLYDANLYDANLYDADLYGADLYGAYLRGADLRGADLRYANLRYANLRYANLRGADLRYANLSDANLSDADLRYADLRYANLHDANIEGVAASLGIEVDLTLPARILAQIEAHPETHDQSTWHSACGTKHCVAGWACALSGEAGKALDEKLGTATAATLLLWRPGVTLPSFDREARSEETLGALREMVDGAPRT